MSRSAGYTWRLRQVMAAHGVWKTSDIGPLLAERGVVLSPSQVYRLAAKVPERLSLHTLVALCGIFDCTPNDLIGMGPAAPAAQTDGDDVVELARLRRPRRARVNPDRR